MRRSLAPLAVGLAVVGITACSVGPEDFADEAEDFIQDEDGDLASAAGMTFTDAACDEPADTDVNTEFACTAVGSDGVTYEFAAIIDGDRSFKVGVIGPASGSEPSDTAATDTAAADTADTAGAVTATSAAG
ncbi:MAG: hypothetical protein ACK5OX_09965 [Desertimonas sp.]